MKSRVYRLGARAEGIDRTRTAILDAMDRVFLAAPGQPFSLDQVAGDAGTTVQTILRHFGTKGGLLEAASLRRLSEVRSERDEVPVGDIEAVAAYLGGHYEDQGPMVLALLAVEEQMPEIAAITRRGRAMHRAWVERVFAPAIAAATARERRRRIATFVAITDLLTWKVLRREQGLSRAEYVRAVHDLLEAFT